MRTYLKWLSRNRLYTAVNVVGLSVALAFVTVIGLYAQMEFGRDRWHAKSDRIYSLFLRTDGEESESSHWAMQPLLCSHFPEIEASCGVSTCSAELQLANQEKKDAALMCADPNFFQMFDFPLVEGSPEQVLQTPNSVVLTEETAKLLFGDSSAMGKDVVLNDSLHMQVTGVMKQLNHTYMAKVDAVVSTEMAPVLGGYYGYKDESMNSYGNTRVYLLAREGSDLPSQLPTMNRLLAQRVWLFKPDSPFPSALTMHRLADIYFLPHEAAEGTTQGNRQQAQLLMLAGLVILLFAVMNYINLTMAQSTFRMREMAMRRLLGAQRWSVMARLISESLMLCLLSLVLAVVLVYAAEPYLNTLLTSSDTPYNHFSSFSAIDIIQADDLWQPLNLLALLAFTLLLGCLAGLMPAIVTSSAKPIEVVRGAFNRKTKMYFSRLFIIFQHVVTIVLIGVALTMWLQIRHLVSAPLGYNTERLMYITTHRWSQDKKLSLLFEEVKKLAGVEEAVVGMHTPLSGGNNNTEEIDGRQVPFQFFAWSEGFMQLMGINVLEDYGTRGKNGLRRFVTPRVLAEFGLPADARSFTIDCAPMQVDGLIEPFKLGNILSDMDRPIIVEESPHPFCRNILLKYTGDEKALRRQIAPLFEHIFERPMEASNCMTYEEMLTNEFKSQINILQLVTLFGFVSLVVSLLGLLAMSTYYIQQRRREVAVRKVFGSTNREVLVRLLRQFMSYVGIAFILSIPIIYYICSHWLSQYSYRIALSPWIFVAAGFVCFIISLLTVIVQSWRAASENPVSNIKSE